MPYVLTPLAEADIFDIWSYIADDNENAADRIEQAIYDACAFVAEAPMRGHSRPEITTRSLRFWTLTAFQITQLCTGQRRPRMRSLPLCAERKIFGASQRSASDAAVFQNG